MRSKKSRLWLLAIALVAVAMVAAGCGGGDDNNGNDAAAAAATQPADTGGNSGGDSGGSATSSDPNIQAAVKACEQQIDSNPQLSAGAKTDLKDVCQKAASGDAAGAQKAAKEVCQKIVEDTVPAGAAQDQAKAACDQIAPAG
jgi:hypothetical protein